MSEEMSVSEKRYDRKTQDVGNVLALEHVNVTVPDQELAALFYVSGMGFTRDPYIDFGTANMWINVGSQQFHLPRADAQVFTGTIGLVVPDIDRLRGRLKKLSDRSRSRLEGTSFDYTDNEDGSVSVRCPWGNQLRVHAAGDDFGGLDLGMPYVEIDVAAGRSAGIARFYEQVMGAPTIEGDRQAEVRVGRSQTLRFIETTEELPAYDGHHLAVYLANFSGPYDAMVERDLITMESNDHEYRFQDIVDPDTGEVLATIEHEVRSMFHPMFDRELVNRNAGQSFGSYRAGHDAHVGLTHGGHG